MKPIVCKIIGIDMGKSNVLTAAYRHTCSQRVHMSNVKTSKEDRFKTLSKTNKAWRHYSGQMAYPFLIKKWIKKFVPNLDSRPTTKTTNTETIMESYRFMNNQWENGTDAESGGGLKEAFFSPMHCSCCMEEMKAGCVFRLKCCRNNPCVRTTWNRDTNAAINMFNLLLWKTLYEDRPRTFSRTERKKRNKYVVPSQCIRAL
eukprot:CAMPEP_0118799648 /NCGR_PEP_ID=MMETSP1161-20130426/1807_1 /TAXON_ID=249345 /ORGANISM="Picochlorum oklahomensis, Strain CCMP2329" /LENGTH=201 /DNA_ID=CAMNT_0006727383 /DNA_START=640 /DNA_END=1241 /DNA_ORIENTATION=+